MKRITSVAVVIAAALAGTAVFAGIIIVAATISARPSVVPDKSHLTYDKGVNDALTTMMLLSLEQQLQETNRTWSEMADITRERLHVQHRQYQPTTMRPGCLPEKGEKP